MLFTCVLKFITLIAVFFVVQFSRCNLSSSREEKSTISFPDDSFLFPKALGQAGKVLGDLFPFTGLKWTRTTDLALIRRTL